MLAEIGVGGVTYGGLNQFDQVTNISGYYTKQATGNVAANANLLEKKVEAIGDSESGSASINKRDEIKVRFNYNGKYDKIEFARQLADQEKGMSG